MFRDTFHENRILDTLVFPILDSSEIGICIIGKNGIIQEINDAFLKLFGFSRSEVVNKHFSTVIMEENKEYSLKQHEDFMENGYFDKREVLLRKKSGKFFFSQVTDLKINDEAGNLYRTTSFLDVTEKKHNELVKMILGKLPVEAEPADTFESMFRIVHASTEQLMPACNFYAALYDEGSEAVSYLYKANELFDGEDENNNTQVYDQLVRRIMQAGGPVLLKGEALRCLFDQNTLDEEIIPRVVLGSVLKIKGVNAGVMLLPNFEDKDAFTESHLPIIGRLAETVSTIMERRKYEEQLTITMEKAEESNRMKTAFLAQMSHEIRTPINTILSFTSLVKEKCEGILEEELKESFNIIESGGRRLIRTIDMILNMSQLQSEGIDTNPQELDLAADIIAPVMKDFCASAKAKNLSFSFNNQLVGEKIVGDQSTIKQTFEQLIDNAIKYTRTGRVEISQYHNSMGRVCVSVKDTGIGISKEYLPKLFTAFSQEEMGYTRRFEGNGLGLAMVKKYIEMNNASIMVESEKGQGSTFTVVFP
ncbi:MAG: ATP-binding protein [Bacteroidota bacterium]|jgi:PAS domain S-box-containing protein|nr:PAS domain S-box protein [Ignavibacteria bacterium]MCU7498402.1 PAS domain S-box protein [Ignavibacteria bacterium]MCU7511944.1 PAS domain S-box protein [Ignavibacteria bacterium]MCU7520023.1 PAS domain S-box protein [Ignavibacteria bacterium]MCU7523097.1 PAS domain S-box protein [Ignavibacteria bacterium]